MAQLRLRLHDQGEREVPLGLAQSQDVIAATPWRTFRSHRKQRHYSGWYWSSTTGGHVVYESRLELARLLLADADPDVVAIAAQPFLLIENHDSKARRHVPDFFFQHRNGTCTVVNVKPASRAASAARPRTQIPAQSGSCSGSRTESSASTSP